MKSLLTLSIIVLMFSAANAPSWFESSVGIAREEFQVGPLFLEIAMLTTERSFAQNSPLPITSIGVNTDIASSLAPLHVRVVVLLNIERDHSVIGGESANFRTPDAKSPPVWEGFQSSN